MSEQWHEARVWDDGETEMIEIDHTHPEPATECDLSLYLDRIAAERRERTTDEPMEWDRLFAGGTGYFRLRLHDGDLEVEPINVELVVLP